MTEPDEGGGRRRFLRSAASAGLTGVLAQAAGAQPPPAGDGAQPKPAVGVLGADGAGPDRPTIAMLVHPGMILQDFAGPLTVFNLLRAEIHLCWKTLDPVRTETGVTVSPTTRFADCPAAVDVLFAPGGLEGTIACLADPEVIGFLRSRGERARWVTSDCTGSLLLGAAGLLKGYRAASHWSVIDQLALYGGVPTRERVVRDRNRLTGGGVTAGIDFGLTLAAQLRGPEQAQSIQLVIEYAPAPPFDAGLPTTAPKAVYERVAARRAPVVEQARRLGVTLGERLRA